MESDETTELTFAEARRLVHGDMRKKQRESEALAKIVASLDKAAELEAFLAAGERECEQATSTKDALLEEVKQAGENLALLKEELIATDDEINSKDATLATVRDDLLEYKKQSQQQIDQELAQYNEAMRTKHETDMGTLDTALAQKRSELAQVEISLANRVRALEQVRKQLKEVDEVATL